jgi:hypothetical protein
MNASSYDYSRLVKCGESSKEYDLVHHPVEVIMHPCIRWMVELVRVKKYVTHAIRAEVS